MRAVPKNSDSTANIECTDSPEPESGAQSRNPAFRKASNVVARLSLTAPVRQSFPDDGILGKAPAAFCAVVSNGRSCFSRPENSLKRFLSSYLRVRGHIIGHARNNM